MQVAVQDEELVESGVQQFRIDVLPKLAGKARSAQYRTIVLNCKSVEFRTPWFVVYGVALRTAVLVVFIHLYFLIHNKGNPIIFSFLCRNDFLTLCIFFWKFCAWSKFLKVAR